MRTFSFSVKPTDTSTLKLVKTIQLEAIRNGQTFSFIVLQALKAYVAKESK